MRSAAHLIRKADLTEKERLDMRRRLPGAGATHAPAVGRPVARTHCMQHEFCGVGAAIGVGGGRGGGEGVEAGTGGAAAVGATFHVSQVPQKCRPQTNSERGIKQPLRQRGPRVRGPTIKLVSLLLNLCCLHELTAKGM